MAPVRDTTLGVQDRPHFWVQHGQVIFIVIKYTLIMQTMQTMKLNTEYSKKLLADLVGVTEVCL